MPENGLRIHRLPIPTPWAVGRVNCYLVEDDPLTLVDTGPNSGASLDALEQALLDDFRGAAFSHLVDSIERVDEVMGNAARAGGRVVQPAGRAAWGGYIGYVTDPDGDQFFAGQPAELAALVPTATHARFTQAEGASYHCQPLARELTEQRMFDWLDEQIRA